MYNTEGIKPCPFCGGEVYYRMTVSGVVFFNCIHCGAGVTFNRAEEPCTVEQAKKKWNTRKENVE